MGRLAGFKYRKIVSLLKKFGFEFFRQAAGSHEIWYNPQTNRFTTTPKLTPAFTPPQKAPIAPAFMICPKFAPLSNAPVILPAAPATTTSQNGKQCDKNTFFSTKQQISELHAET